MPSTSDQRALASTLSALDDAELAALLAARGVAPTAGWRDLYDAADALLDAASVARGLSALPHAPAAAVSAAARTGAPVDAAQRPAVIRAALADDDGVLFAAVRAVVQERPEVGDEPVADSPASSERGTAAAAERAFTHTSSVADILLRTLETPLARIGSGELGASDRRALVETGAAPDAGLADTLVGLAAAVGLLSATDRSWRAGDGAWRWLTVPTAERWSRVATALREALPSGLRATDGGWIPVAAWPGAYPYDPAWPARAQTWRARLSAWGLVDDEGALPPWAEPLAAGNDPDTSALAALLPGEVDRLYLQNDLTAIAPGPLAPHLDVRLRRMARRESRAQASSYRFDADTVSASIAAGETAASLREFLTAISLTGVPQPLAYLIDRAADRHGRVRVSTDPDSGRARVSSDDSTLIDTIGVDHSLRALGLVRDGSGLVSRLGAEAVFWALADARYPAVAVDAEGVPVILQRARLAPATPPPTPAQNYAALLERLRTAAGSDGDAAWLERELDHAARTRALLDVVVSLPDGSSRTFRLEASGFGGGRLRGRDRAADVERTLPLTNIVSVHPVE